MLAALLIKGISPGPELISAHPDIFWGLVVSFVVGNVLLVIWHIPFIRLWVKLLAVPFDILFPSVLLLICLGVYTIHNSTMDILLVLVFGCIGYGMRLLHFEPAPLLIGLVLGPLLESYLRRSLIVSHGNAWAILERPISGCILLASAIILAWTFRKRAKSIRPPTNTKVADGSV
jgi:TctA family transporter